MIQTECGIYAVISTLPITHNKIITGLKNLQHRGRDSFGVSYYNKEIKVEKHQDLVKNLDTNATSKIWVGHVRYSTSTKMMKYCQPIIGENKKFSIVHNGNIPEKLWKKFYFEHDIYDSDTYKLKLFIEHNRKHGDSLESSLIKIIKEIEGSYCILIQTNEYIYALRDRHGVRPLGYQKDNEKIIISSESKDPNCIDILPGSLIKINIETLEVNNIYKHEEINKSKCVFEYIYFMRETTHADNVSVKNWRVEIGKKLVKQTEELIKNLDKGNILVCGVPTSGIVYGESYSYYSGLEYCQFLKKRKDYPHRTFILENNQKRLSACEKKYFIDENLENKTLILIDDSVVRGNTMKYLVQFIRKCNPKEIHLLVASPPIKNPCDYGVDFPDIEELIVNKISKEELTNYFKLDSITYLELESLKEMDQELCSGCFTGNYMF